ncbi:MAG: hypothetical protein K2X82_09340 [Gemmataceae bacterium]|nr:hypothetical protein [Gemmataceae bacterium]
MIRLLGRLSPLDCFREERFWRYALLPLAGSMLPVLVLAIHKGNPVSESLVGLVSAVARALPTVLLIRVLDRDPAGPFRLRVSWTALAVCFVGFSGPIVIGVRPGAWHGAMQSAVYPLLLTGVLAGVVSAVPPGELIRRAARHRMPTGLAVIGLLPYVHRLLLAPEWRILHPISITLTRWLLDLAGIGTTETEYFHKRFGFAVLIQAQHWDVLISKECSGFARVLIFVALFASMLLQNPARLQSSVAVATSFIGGLVAVLSVESVRWAALVAFAEHTLHDVGHTRAAYRSIETYHRAGGQWSVSLSLVLFAAYFYVVSRWLDRRAGLIRQTPG